MLEEISKENKDVKGNGAFANISTDPCQIKGILGFLQGNKMCQVRYNYLTELVLNIFCTDREK